MAVGPASREEATREAFRLVQGGYTAWLRELLASQPLDLHAFFQHEEREPATLLHHAACAKKHEIIELLLELGAPVDIGEKRGWTPLHSAAFFDDERSTSLLLAHGADVNAVNRKNGQTPLFVVQSARVAQLLIAKGAGVNRYDTLGESVLRCAVYRVQFNNPDEKWKVVELLLRHGANINHINKDGDNALHVVASDDEPGFAFVKRLVDLGADPNGRNQRGWTPLHVAVTRVTQVYNRDEHVLTVESLLAAGSDVHAQDKGGNQAIHVALHSIFERGVELFLMRCLQLLVFNGAKWDELCEEFLAKIKGRSRDQPTKQWMNDPVSLDVARAVRLCIQHWRAAFKNRLPATEIPLEDIKRGFQATKTYLNQLSKSTHVVLRRKICVVGPSYWGKTSLVKSLVSNKPSLVHPDDRTIGIDKFKLSFDQLRSATDSVVHHEVTFWDFAGQDEYQVAHSLFFSRRTLYMVCVDMGDYARTFYKAEMMTRGDPMALSERMNWVVETRILRWIRLIIARQPDAEFQFIGTKSDLVDAIDADALADLESRLANVLVVAQEIVVDDKVRITHLGDGRLELMATKPAVEMTFVSCIQPTSVIQAMEQIKSLICKSDRSYTMPDSYSEVLRIIKEKRKAAQAAPLRDRVDQCFVKVDTLVSELAARVEGIDTSTSRDILRALRDIGDVLWYEDVDDKTLRETVVLDPLLLVELIRQIFNHKMKSEVMWHADLKQLDVWKNICEDDQLLLAMKRLLQRFHLAYPTEKDHEMQWDSDLMLPASWRSKTSAQLMFMGQPLNHPYGVSQPRDWQVDVHWEIEIDSGFEGALFDRLVVATYDPAFIPRRVGPDYILYGDASSADSRYACRLVVDWHRKTHKRVLHLEAVHMHTPRATTADANAIDLWDRFECICVGLAAVFTTFPGLRASSCARVGGSRCTRPKLGTCTTPVAKWLPPEPTLSKCRRLLTLSRIPGT